MWRSAQWRSAAGVLAVAVAVVAAGPVRASDLELDGRVSVTKLMGDTLRFTVRGGPNLQAFLFLDVSRGPTRLFGRDLPLGFTPAHIVVPLGNTDQNGEAGLTVTVPSSPRFAGGKLYALAVVLDPTAPFGLDISNGGDVTFLDRNVDLCGNALGTFPFFEHVAAINEGSTVELGVDPTRYPVVVGRTADVYVVASKTRTRWIADPTLVDVRPGGAQTVTFGGSTIQVNTFTLDNGALAGPDATPGAGDTRVGVGYDVVIDLDRDGRFDDDLDLIDGYDDGEAGFYVVRDTARGSVGPAQRLGPGTGAGGPYAVTEILYDLGGVWTPIAGSPRSFLRQDCYYPTNIAQLGRLPLVAISHGNGHDYPWYDHLGYHLASYGYVVMSHTNNTQPGTFAASRTTLDNTDAFLGSLAVIAGGILDGHVDGDNIVWIGHSRGGDSIVRAYDQLVDRSITMANYDADDIKLLSSMAPVQDGGPSSSNPHGVAYHLWVGAGDTNVPGCACLDREQWYIMHDRARKFRQATCLYGVGHGWFHAQTSDSPWVIGPCQIGEPNTHLIMKGYFVPLIKRYLEGDVPSKDFLWRQYESFRPIGVPFDPCIVVNLLYQESADTQKLVLDDFESEPSNSVASSGAGVSTDLPGLREGELNDGDASFDWTRTDPFNGFIMASDLDQSRGTIVRFDGGDHHLTYDLLPTQRRLCEFEYLSFRAAQTTRHPNTTALLGDLTFSVMLVDGSGNSSSIDFGAYGGGIEEPYQRTANPFGCASCVGAVPGWNNELETIRVRLGDFLNNGNAVDLADVRQVSFRFGPSWGSALGRIGLDEIELTRR